MNIEDIHAHLLVINKLLDDLPKINSKQTGGKKEQTELSNTSNESNKENEKTKSDTIESPPKPIEPVNDPDYSISIMEMV